MVDDAGSIAGPSPLSLSSSLEPINTSRWLPADLSLDPAIQLQLLDDVLGLTQQVGVLAVLRRNHRKILADNISLSPGDWEAENNFLTSRSVIAALLLCGSCFQPAFGSIFGEALIEECRTRSLSDMAVLTWNSRPISPSDIYCLCLLSNLSFLNHELTEVAGRWAMLSKILALSHMSLSSPSSSLPELHRRVLSLLDINTQVHAVLFNQYKHGNQRYSGLPVQTLDLPSDFLNGTSLPDVTWHGCSHHHDSTKEGYFNLFLPLQQIMQTAQFFSSTPSGLHNPVAEALEDYFISFPTRLMEMDKVNLAWQLEAMIWFHGIYIYTAGCPDFLNILLLPRVLQDSSFANVADHAILLGDILPFLTGIDSAILRLSHLTVYFVALSAAVHVSMIRGLHDNTSSAPPLLIRSARAHEHVLRSICESNLTCTHPVLENILKILTTTLHAESHGRQVDLEELIPHLQAIKRYRWIPGGRGLLCMDEAKADDLLQELIHQHMASDFSLISSSDIQRILKPSTRINQPGTFDLSILF